MSGPHHYHTEEEYAALRIIIEDIMSDGMPRTARWVRANIKSQYGIELGGQFIQRALESSPFIERSEKYCRGYEYRLVKT